MSEAPRRSFPPTMLGAPLPGEEGRPAGEPGATVQEPPLPTPLLEAGHVLAEATLILLRHFLPILFLTALLYVPYLYLGTRSRFIATFGFAGGQPSAGEMVGGLVWWPILILMLPYVLQGMLVAGVLRARRGERAGFLRHPGTIVRQAPVVLATAFLLMLSLGAVVALAVILVGVTGSPPLGLLVMLGGVGVLGCLYFVVVPMVVVEDVGLWTAFARSPALTRSALSSVFGILFVISLLGVVTLSFLNVVAPIGPGKVMATSLVVFVILVFAAMQAVCAAVAYADLRENTERRAIEEFTDVFE